MRRPMLGGEAPAAASGRLSLERGRGSDGLAEGHGEDHRGQLWRFHGRHAERAQEFVFSPGGRWG
ncbi:protein of unknown function [Magnetospirillum sp. XM-1]|nr:protein of unknown function [Magnetospirillum sp. XM-1]